MKKEEVPQDKGIAEGCREICYAVDEEGRYRMELSMGWEAKNVANAQAWEVIEGEMKCALSEIARGQKSVLAYFMARSQMNAGLLGQYVGMSAFRVRWHLRPGSFKRLKPKVLERYAEVFGVSREAFSLSVDALAKQAIKE